MVVPGSTRHGWHGARRRGPGRLRSGCDQAGLRTQSMMWTTPLEAPFFFLFFLVVGRDLCAVDEDVAAGEPDGQLLAHNGREHSAVREVLGERGAGHHVVGEHIDELRLVRGLEQVVQHAGG